jgi:indole-3-glycerol phosphate synthase
VTEKTYFAGEPASLKDIRREFSDLPLLRKDFLFEPYQVIESRAWGASAILAIVACVERSQLASLLSSAEEFQLGVLVEVHDPWELEIAIGEGASIIGVNNRNLNDFRIDLATSFDIARRLEGEDGYLLISESGLSERAQLLELRQAGFSGFLIGSHFMNNQKPGRVLRELLKGEGNGG